MKLFFITVLHHGFFFVSSTSRNQEDNKADSVASCDFIRLFWPKQILFSRLLNHHVEEERGKDNPELGLSELKL